MPHALVSFLATRCTTAARLAVPLATALVAGCASYVMPGPNADAGADSPPLDARPRDAAPGLPSPDAREPSDVSMPPGDAGEQTGCEPSVRVSTSGMPELTPSLAWTGTEYGLAWTAGANSPTPSVRFVRLSADGVVVPGAPVAFPARARPRLLWAGDSWLLGSSVNNGFNVQRLSPIGGLLSTAIDRAGSFRDLRALALFDSGVAALTLPSSATPGMSLELYTATGEPIASPAFDAPGAAVEAFIQPESLATTGTGFAVVRTRAAGLARTLELFRATDGGRTISMARTVPSSMDNAGLGVVASNPRDGELGVAWTASDTAGNSTTWFVRLDAATGALRGAPVPVGSGAPEILAAPALAWTGAEYGVVWATTSSDAGRRVDGLWLTRISPTPGVSPVRVLVSAAPDARPQDATVVWNAARGVYAVAWADERDHVPGGATKSDRNGTQIYFAHVPLRCDARDR